MDGTHSKEVSTRTKYDKLHGFLKSFGYDTDAIIQDIKAATSELTDDDVVIVDVLCNSMEGLQKRSGKSSIIEAIKVMGCVSSANIINVKAGLTTKVMILVVYVLKVIFRIVDLKELLDPKCTFIHITVHEFSGLAEKIAKKEILIDAVEMKENVDEPSLHSLISNFDIHIGVDLIGNLKSRIKSMMSEGQDMQTCLHFLTLFVRLSTLRHALLFRFKTCLEVNNYSSSTSDTLKTYIDQERADSEEFLRFFSLPSLENVYVLAVFDPAEEIELATYLEDLRLPLQNLQKVLDGKIFNIQPYKNPSILLGRNFPSFGAARAMKSSTDVDNVRIQFEFEAVEKSFNLFYIKSPDLKEYLYMTTTLYCDYSKNYKGQTGAQWRVIQVKDTKGREDDPSLFVLCTRKQPRNFLYIQAAVLIDFARGLGDKREPPGTECLFQVSMAESIATSKKPSHFCYIYNLFCATDISVNR